jgi:hemoglobin-like flavoprotein
MLGSDDPATLGSSSGRRKNKGQKPDTPIEEDGVPKWAEESGNDEEPEEPEEPLSPPATDRSNRSFKGDEKQIRKSETKDKDKEKDKEAEPMSPTGKSANEDEDESRENSDAAKQKAKSGDSDETGAEINVNTFEELRLPGSLVRAAQDAWRIFVSAAETQEAAGEAIYTALFEGAPSLQSLFTTPRAVQAMRFMNGLRSFVTELDDPGKLKILVETLGFGHLHLDVTIPRVVIFRDAILDLFQIELGERLTSNALDGWKKMLNYVGGAIIFVKAHYADRIACLLSSWKICNKSSEDHNAVENEASHESRDHAGTDHGTEHHHKGGVSGWLESKKQSSKWPFRRKKKETQDGDAEYNTTKAGKGDDAERAGAKGASFQVQNVPTTYPDMFLFNAAVMGFGQSAWMVEVLECFNDIVVNVANSARLQQECAILALRIAKKGFWSVYKPDRVQVLHAGVPALAATEGLGLFS